jgi:hypothetical protein
MPDPMRAHGAWIFLFCAVGAGALLGADRRVEIPLLVGTGLAGGYLLAGAVAVGARRKRRQGLVGLLLLLIAPLAALLLGAERAFLVAAGATALPAVLAVVFARRRGVLSRVAVITGIAALAGAAPAAALAGGAGAGRATAAFALLWPFFCWRSLRIAAALEGGAAWERSELRARGLREAGIAAVWTLLVATVLLRL